MSPIYDLDAAVAAAEAVQARHREICEASRALMSEVCEAARRIGLSIVETQGNGWSVTLDAGYTPRPVLESETLPIYRMSMVGLQFSFARESPVNYLAGHRTYQVNLRYDTTLHRFVVDQREGITTIGYTGMIEETPATEDAAVAILRMIMRALLEMPEERGALDVTPHPLDGRDYANIGPVGADMMLSEDQDEPPTPPAPIATVWERIRARLLGV